MVTEQNNKRRLKCELPSTETIKNMMCSYLFVLHGAALYAHRFSDDVGEESMGHGQHQQCKSFGGTHC